ncbi:DUF973 family protein [Sulfolobus tengchongensis]|uniref:DUF973 family protein n=1 Tax=Sulfolobus tengchongensis TaxID=207809 RepID=A0AAX4KWT6_9CREN
MSQQNIETIGLAKLRNGVTYLIINAILSIISAVILLTILFSMRARLPIISGSIIVLVIGIVLVGLALLNMREGFSLLTSLGRDLRRGITGTSLVLVGLIIFFISILYLLLLLPTIRFGIHRVELTSIIGIVALELIGGIIAFIGYLFVALSFRDLGKFYNNRNLDDGGLFVLIGAILSIFISIVGAIVEIIGFFKIRSGLDEVMKGQYQQQQIPPPSSPIGQIGIGKLYSNGIAEVMIYSQYQLQILNAIIMGTSYSTADISPNQLSIGYNNIKMNFKTSFMFTPGNIYVIQLTLSNGQTLNVTVTYQP